MTKKHFQKLAYGLMLARPAMHNGPTATYQARLKVWQDCCREVCGACRESNPNFDWHRFMEACNADSYTPSMHGR